MKIQEKISIMQKWKDGCVIYKMAKKSGKKWVKVDNPEWNFTKYDYIDHNEFLEKQKEYNPKPKTRVHRVAVTKKQKNGFSKLLISGGIYKKLRDDETFYIYIVITDEYEELLKRDDAPTPVEVKYQKQYEEMQDIYYDE
jgi:hypothetical protein